MFKSSVVPSMLRYPILLAVCKGLGLFRIAKGYFIFIDLKSIILESQAYLFQSLELLISFGEPIL